MQLVLYNEEYEQIFDPADESSNVPLYPANSDTAQNITKNNCGDIVRFAIPHEDD